jgi:hypothetical protein
VTSPDIIKVKTIAALLEAIDAGDPKDAAEALKMIRMLVGERAEAK